MEAKKHITYKVTKGASGNGTYSEEYSSAIMSRYIKVIILFILMLLSYKICVSKDSGYKRSINEKANKMLADTAIRDADTNRTDSDKCFAPAVVNVNRSMDSSYATTLNLLASQNETIVDSIVNSYFDGVNDADSEYKVNKSIKAGAFLMTIVASPLISVFPVAISSIVHPSGKHLHVDAVKLNNPAYMKGYVYQAHYIKKRQLWGAFLEGGTPWCILSAFLLL
jgi:hypothetical protein